MQIQNFNRKLIDENVEITIIDYVRLLNYEVYHIDISFIDDFIGLVYKDECCIHHDMLVKYGVLSLTSGTYDVKIIIEQQNLKVIHVGSGFVRNLQKITRQKMYIIYIQDYLN